MWDGTFFLTKYLPIIRSFKDTAHVEGTDKELLTHYNVHMLEENKKDLKSIRFRYKFM